MQSPATVADHAVERHVPEPGKPAKIPAPRLKVAESPFRSRRKWFGLRLRSSPSFQSQRSAVFGRKSCGASQSSRGSRAAQSLFGASRSSTSTSGSRAPTKFWLVAASARSRCCGFVCAAFGRPISCAASRRGCCSRTGAGAGSRACLCGTGSCTSRRRRHLCSVSWNCVRFLVLIAR